MPVDARKITQWALELPEEDRLELARRLVESLESLDAEALVSEGIRRIEEVAKGEVIPLTEEQFRTALE